LIRLRWGSFIFVMTTAILQINCGSSAQPNPTPVITSIFPDSITAGSAMFNIDITGLGFLQTPTSVALWNGSPRTTTFNVSTGHLTLTVLAADVTNASIALISVTNPGPGGGTSTGTSFTINPLQNGAPTNISLDPSSANAGTLGPFLLTVNGTNFVTGSIIRWNGTFRQPISVTPTSLTTNLATSDLASAGFAFVSVDNPLPGGIVASSISVDFLINSGNSNASPRVISVNAAGGRADGASASPAISGDGRFVAFYSVAKNLVPRGASGNIFVRDTCLGAVNCAPHTIAVDIAPDNSAPNARADSEIAISGDGRFVTFASYATNLAAGSTQRISPGGTVSDGNWNLSLFIRDMCVGANVPAGCTPHTELIASDVIGQRFHGFSPSLSADGRYAAFVYEAPNGAPASSSNKSQVYARDTCAGPTATVACVPKTIPVVSTGSSPGDDDPVSVPRISGNGRYVVFQNLIPDGPKVGGKPSSQILLRDTCLGAAAPAVCNPSTLKISMAPDGTPLQGMNSAASVSADARFVAFGWQESAKGEGESAAQNIFLRDTCLGPTASDSCVPSTRLIYSQNSVVVGALDSLRPSISASGRYISLVAAGAGMAPNSAGSGTLSVYDTCFGASTTCTPGVSLAAVPGAAQQPVPLSLDRISPVPLTADGRYAAFYSVASADPAAPVSGRGDVFLTSTPVQ
jgi:hypothetical protein